MGSKSPKNEVAKTQASLAKALAARGIDITQQGLSKRIARGQIPAKGPWDVVAVAATISAARSRKRSVDEEEVLLKRERRRKLRLERGILEGRYVDRAERDRREAETYGVVRSELVNLSESGVVAAIRQAVTEHEAKAILQGRVFEVLGKLSGFDGSAGQ